MGLILQHKLELVQPSLSISNNIFRGEYILDADIKVEMICGYPGSAFEIKVPNLPEKEVKKLAEEAGKKPLPITIGLGYMDFPFETVMEGLVKEVEAAVAENKLVVTLKGGERATQLLTDSKAKQDLVAGTTASAAVTLLIGDIEETPGAGPPGIGSEIDPAITEKLQERVKKGSLLAMLDELARLLNVELFVVDGKVWLGRPVLRRTDYLPPPSLQPDGNLAGFEPFKKKLPKEISAFHLEPLPAGSAEGFRFKIAGDPKLRPGHPVIPLVDGYGPTSGLNFRVVSLKHTYNATAGYLCEGIALKYETGNNNTRREGKAVPRLCAGDIAQLMSDRIDSAIKQRPFVEIGQVKEAFAAAGGDHQAQRANLFYGQEVGKEILPAEPQPSVRATVRQEEKELFKNKPLLSPFAWHKCGLVVPVYKGMKAVLLHNQGRAEDAMVAGFTWSEQPAIDPPSAQAGDWWLCLPADYDGSAAPSGSTKATNDLIASDGKRVIEAKGLKITVGASKLGTVGNRPAEGGDDELLIEHASGTKIQIDSSGNVTLDAGSHTVTVKAQSTEIQGDTTVKGNLFVTGNVDID